MTVCGSAVAERCFSWQTIFAGGTPLLSQQIHLWLVNIEDLLQTTNQDLLTVLENARSKRIIDEKHRALYLGGRLGLRLLASAYSGIDNNALQFGYAERGKPRLLNQCDNGELCFNYTLSSGYALYAFAWNRQLGVDIEVFPRSVNADLLAQRKLTDLEKTNWLALPHHLRNDGMLACWTRKEAYGKVLGVGIRYFMNRVGLFDNIQESAWTTEVAGLFEPQDAGSMKTLRGVQIALPVAGSATLMYDITNNNHHSQSPESEDSISAFRLTV